MAQAVSQHISPTKLAKLSVRTGRHPKVSRRPRRPSPSNPDPIFARIAAYMEATVAFNTAIGGNAEERLSPKVFAKLEQTHSDRSEAALDRLLQCHPVTLSGLKAALDFVMSIHVAARALKEDHEAVNAFLASLATGFGTLMGSELADPIFDGEAR